MVFLTMYYMSWAGDSVISICFGNLKIRQCNVIYSKRASHGMFLINNKCVF